MTEIFVLKYFEDLITLTSSIIGNHWNFRRNTKNQWNHRNWNHRRKNWRISEAKRCPHWGSRRWNQEEESRNWWSTRKTSSSRSRSINEGIGCIFKLPMYIFMPCLCYARCWNPPSIHMSNLAFTYILTACLHLRILR